MQGMAGLMSFDPRKQRQPSKGKITNQVQSLVTAKLIGEAQRAVHDPVLGEDNGVFERPAPDQAHGAERGNIALETECTRTSKQMAESARADQHLHFLLSHQRMREIHVASDAELASWVDANATVAFTDFQRLQDFQITTLAAQLAHSGLLQHLHEGLRRAIQNWNLDRVDVDVDIVDAAGIDGREEVLGGREQNTLLHKAGGIADARHVVALSLNGEVV